MSKVQQPEVDDIDHCKVYVHSRRISSPTIRVLRLSKSELHFGDKSFLQGSLKDVSLNSRTQFDAISYACGSPEPPSYILIDRKKIPITRNCEDALRRLRDNFGLTTVWVDSICINSPDDVERSGQLLLMTHIYGKARNVYLWMGEASYNNASDFALDWLEQASENQYPLLGAAVGTFPRNMSPRNATTLFLLLFEYYRDSELPLLKRHTSLIGSS